jgi:hypothetical protein
MEQEQVDSAPTTRDAGIRFGLISALISIFYFLAITMAGLTLQGPAGWFQWMIGAVLIFLAHKYYKDNGSGFMNYGQGIGIAFWMGLISSIISAVFTFIYAKFIDTTFIDNLKDAQLEKFQEQGMSETQIDQAMKISEMFFTPGAMMIMGLIIGILGTIVIALIVTIFTQKKNPDTVI